MRQWLLVSLALALGAQAMSTPQDSVGTPAPAEDPLHLSNNSTFIAPNRSTFAFGRRGRNSQHILAGYLDISPNVNPYISLKSAPEVFDVINIFLDRQAPDFHQTPCL